MKCGEGQRILETGTWTIGLGHIIFTVIYSPIEMKPLHPVIKYSLAIGISGIVLLPGFIKVVREDPSVTRMKEYGEQNRKFMEELDKRGNARNNNR